MGKAPPSVRQRVRRLQLLLLGLTLLALALQSWFLIANPPSSRVRVTIPEGFTRFEIAKRLAAAGVCSTDSFLKISAAPLVLENLSIRAPSAEGYLFPDTYEFERGTPAEVVLSRMLRNFERRTRDIFAGARRRDGWSAHDYVVLASIVEKEAAVASERPTIAGVFFNRLEAPSFTPRRLQADPTVAYGCLQKPRVSPACQRFQGRITRAMLQDPENPYNTYRHDGLPPGPIANPGLASLQAALAPEQHDFFYFVAKGAGLHAFSKSLREHNAAVERYLR